MSTRILHTKTSWIRFRKNIKPKIDVLENKKDEKLIILIQKEEKEVNNSRKPKKLSRLGLKKKMALNFQEI